MTEEELQKDPVLRKMIIGDEGIRYRPYRDTRGIWTGGIGYNLEAHGITTEQIDTWRHTGIPEALVWQWFDAAKDAAIVCCYQVFAAFEELPDDAQRVLVDMAYDLMYELRDWHLLRKAVAKRDWKQAGNEILRSEFAREAPERAQRLAEIMGRINAD